MNEIDSDTSYFITGGTIPPSARSYIERSADRRLLDCLRNGEYCYVLVSRQMGKSSLVIRTMDRLKRQAVQTVMLDLNGLGSSEMNEEQWYYSQIEQIAKELKLNREIEALWDRQEGKTALQKWIRAFEEFLRLRSDHLIIFIDEIDQTRSLPFNTDEFFATIRSFQNRRALESDFKRLTFCLIGVALPADLIENPDLTPFNIAQRIDLIDFEKGQLTPFLAGLRRDAKTGQRLLKRVFYWTNGHPFLTQQFCRAIAEDGSIQTDRDVDDLCGRLFLGRASSPPDDNLNVVSDRLLKGYPDDLAGLLALYQQIYRGKCIPYVRANRLVDILMLAGIIRSRYGRLQVRNRIYQVAFNKTWILDNMPDVEKRRQAEATRQVAVIWVPLLLFVCVLTATTLFSIQQAQIKKSWADTLLYDSDMELIQQAIESDPPDYLRIHELLQDAGQLTDHAGPAQHDFEWNYWNLKDPESSVRLSGHSDRISTVAFSPNNRYIVTGSADNTAKVWMAVPGSADFKAVGMFNGHKYVVSSVAVSPDSRHVLTGSADCTAKMWDAETGNEELALRGHTDRVTAVAFSPGGGRIITGSSDNTARIWKVRQDKDGGKSYRESEVLQISGHKGRVTSVGFSPDGHSVVTGCTDSLVRGWSAWNGKLLYTLAGHTGAVNSFAYSPDLNNRRIASASDDGTVRIWDVQQRKTLVTLVHDAPVTSVAFSPDGSHLVTGSNDAIARVWDVKTGNLIHALSSHTAPVNSVAFSADGRYIVTGSTDMWVKKWNAETGEEVPFPYPHIHRSAVTAVAFAPDNQYIVSGSKDNTARIWKIGKGTSDCTLSGHTYMISSATFSPTNNEMIATGSTDWTVKVWKLLAPSMNGSANANMIQEIFTLRGHTAPVTAVAFSPRSGYIVSGSEDETARVWNACTGALIAILRGHTNKVTSVAFSPDDRYVITGSSDRTAKVWDAKTWKLLREFKGHEKSINSVAFSPNSAYLITGSSDHTTRVWNIDTGRNTRTLRGHNARVNSVAFSPNSQYIVTGSDDGTVKVWDATNISINISDCRRVIDGVLSIEHDRNKISRLMPGGISRRWNWHPIRRSAFPIQTTDDIASRKMSRNASRSNRQRKTRLGRRSTVGSTQLTAHAHIDRDTERESDAGVPERISSDQIEMIVKRLGPKLHNLADDDFRSLISAILQAEHEAQFVPETRSEFVDVILAKVWDTKITKQPLTINANVRAISSLAFSSDSQCIIVGGLEHSARVWNIRALEGALTLKGHKGMVKSLAFSPDSSYIFTGSEDKTAVKWNTHTGEKLSEFPGHTDFVTAVAVAPNGTSFLTGSRDTTAMTWNLKTCQPTHKLPNPQSRITSVAYSLDGRAIAIGSTDKSATTWKADMSQKIQSFQGHNGSIYSIAFSPDGRYLLTGSADSTARLWDVRTGKLIFALQGHRSAVYSVAFSPDGRYIVTAGADKTARVWDVATGQFMMTLTGHTGEVIAAAYSPDGRRIVTGSADHTAKVWDAMTGKAVLTLKGHIDTITSVAFSPDGQYIATGSADNTAKIWYTH